MTDMAPIFIIGTGRCGSTMFHDALSHHPGLSWLTQLVNRKPSKPQYNAMVMRLLKSEALDPLIRRYFYPAEPYSFFEKHYKGFSRPFRDLHEEDFREAAANRFRVALKSSALPDKPLIVKYTGWPRVGLLKAIFPKAKFIHIVRDGRAVVSSVLEAPFFDGWAGPNNWTRGELSEAQQEAWQKYNQSFVILAAMGWENRMNAFAAATNGLSGEQYIELSYEDYCSDSIGKMESVIDFLELPERSNDLFFKRLSSISFSNNNEKWRNNFTKKQQDGLEQYLEPSLAKFGYTVKR